ncbi:ISAs1 family transposase [Actinomyces sp. oral taxon 414]|uniref:ISAs1 family transposase n=1 Tax=Actinomyces sp. oral taxon 414 TaxID=712122 RepID=UPI000A459B5F|nr:ISAs1 family transposase [Actinomyces sp. oral taxon 414]
MPSSTTTALSRQPLKEVLEGVTDPRDRRGVRHPLVSVLCLAVTGILAGCRSLTAIWEHAADLEPADLGALGLEEGRALPSESTIRRVLQDLDPAGLDARLTSWFFTRTGAIAGRRVIAVDGKTMRGARTGSNPAPHLLAALDQAAGTALTQRRVADKSNEIPALPELLAPLDLDGAVVTADAMHTQTGTAQWIISRGAHYVLTVKNNQPGLKRALKKLPWKDVPSTSVPDGSHGRRVRRTVQAVEAPAWIDFPGAAQVIRIRRTRTVNKRGGGRRTTTEVAHLICSLPPTDAPPELVASWARGHWAIENRLHWIRDVVFDEDRHQLRTRNGPQIMAALRNLAISLIRLLHGPEPPSPPPPEPWQDAPNEPSDYSPNQPPKPTLPTPCPPPWGTTPSTPGSSSPTPCSTRASTPPITSPTPR